MKKQRRLLGPFVLLSIVLSGCPGDVGWYVDPRLPEPLKDIALRAQQNGGSLDSVLQKIHSSLGAPLTEPGSVERWTLDGALRTHCGFSQDKLKRSVFIQNIFENPIHSQDGRRLFHTCEPDPLHLLRFMAAL
jgi:hypothetical protein